jgi:hypothetical protein
MVYADKEKIMVHVEKLLEVNPAIIKINEADSPEQVAEKIVAFAKKIELYLTTSK